ncbi:MAG: methylenetetrahydrofolate reductase [Candidatus Hermodarchaeota archaeon]
MLPKTHLRELLESGHLVVTAEVGPPQGSDAALVAERVEMIRNHCDAINVTDNPLGVPRMSSLACARLIIDAGVEPIMHIATRSRNEILLQSELFGASALGIRNLLFITGDEAIAKREPQSTVVPEIDSVEGLKLASTLMKGKNSDGEDIEGPPSFFLGSTFNPHAESMDEEIRRIEQKRNAGAQFFQTQAVYEIERFGHFMRKLENLDVRVLAGIVPLQGSEMAEYISAHVPGIQISEAVIARLRDAEEGLADEELLNAGRAEGLLIAAETVKEIRSLKGVDGIHIMGIGWDESILQTVESAGLYPRPTRG